jgi:hypothetical protein
MLERNIPGFDHTLDGKAVARVADLLDSVAKQKGLPTLMSFYSVSPDELAGFASDHGVSLKKPPPLKWFSADDGLRTINGLLDYAENQKLDARVVTELQEFKVVLETAKRNGVGWHLAVDF